MIEIQLLATQRYSKSHGKAWHKRLKAQADPRDPHLGLAPHGTHAWEYRIRQLMFDEDSTQLDQLLEVLDVVGLC